MLHNYFRPVTMTNSGDKLPHIALLPSAGMGHLIPFLRLASSLIHHNFRVTFITTHPTISLSESSLISRFRSYPQFNVKQFHLLPLDPSTANSTDPFFLHMETIRRSAHLLGPLLSSLHPPPSALVSDVSLISPVIPVALSLCLPNYVLFTSSARMFSLFASFSNFAAGSSSLEIPGIPEIPKSSIPPLLLDPTSLFSKIFVQDGPEVKKLNGVLINSFEGLEGEALSAINDGKVVDGLPPVFAVGPLTSSEFENRDHDGAVLKWLDEQDVDSVVYVSFGSRTPMARAQIKELGDGLVRSGFKFVWVVKEKIVDRDEEESLEHVMGQELMDRVREKGMVVKSWVDQWEILRHKAVRGFVSHCGWNSVVEAAWHGVNVLAWPQHGDQKINAEVVERSGFGMFVRNWGWPARQVLVNGEEIGKRIKEMMTSQEIKANATRVRDYARKAAIDSGNFQKVLTTFMEFPTTAKTTNMLD